MALPEYQFLFIFVVDASWFFYAHPFFWATGPISVRSCVLGQSTVVERVEIVRAIGPNPIRGEEGKMAHHVTMDMLEFVSKDPAATQAFLEKAFGFKFNVMGEDMGNYRMLDHPAGARGSGIGIRSLMDDHEHPGSVGYLTVPNLDEAIKSVKAAGGKIVMEKTEIPKTGFMAVYIAPGDVVQGLFQGMSP